MYLSWVRLCPSVFTGKLTVHHVRGVSLPQLYATVSAIPVEVDEDGLTCWGNADSTHKQLRTTLDNDIDEFVKFAFIVVKVRLSRVAS